MRILLMDNQRLLASALLAKLERDPRFEIVAVASDGDDALCLVDETEPDVVLLDAESDTAGTLSATHLISAHESAPRVLILTGAEDRFDPGEAHDAGAAAFLRRPRSAADLAETVMLAAALVGATVSPDERDEQ